MNRLEKQDLEFRWIQNVTKQDSSQTKEGCKAFVRTMPSNIAGFSVEVGNPTENDMTYNVTRVQVYAGGVEIMCIDRLSQILRINGKDYMAEINSLL
jgi:phage tail tube protein FII